MLISNVSLRNKYYKPEVDELSEEQLLADIYAAATEWEQELDEFLSDDNDLELAEKQ